MTNILIHGLGQNEISWNEVKNQLTDNKIKVETPNLFYIAKSDQINYENMYKKFEDYCNTFHEKINLVGLSLGGILAIDYTTKFPEKVNSIVLIGVPYEIPKTLFTIQNIIYKFMPKKLFEKIGCSKKDMIGLLKSMCNLSIPEKSKNVKCSALIICGEKDNTNMKSAKQLNNVIKNSKFKVIENAGHEVNRDNPKELANIICNFWKEI